MVLLNPRDAFPLIKLGDVLCLQGQYKNAINMFNKAVSLNSEKSSSADNATPYYHLGNAYYMMGLYSEAIDNYKKSLE